MFRAATLVLVCLAVGPGGAAPKLKPKPPAVSSLVGTKWVGLTYEKQPLVVEFKADGEVAISYNNSPVKNTGWTQDGDKVYFHMNMKYCEFNGKVVGDKLDGTSENVTGLKWETALTRERAR